MAYPWSTIFAELGKLIKTANTAKTYQTSLDTMKTEVDGALDDGADELDLAADVLDSIQDFQDAADNHVEEMVDHIDTYTTDILGALIDSTYQTVPDILDDMVAKMVTESQTVDGNTIGATETANPAGRAGTGTLESLAATQMALADDLRIECTSAATAGSEVWAIHSRERGQISTTATTGVAYPGAAGPDYAGVSFTVTRKTTCSVANDGSSQLANVDIDGGEKSVNCDTSGKLYCKVLGTGVTAPTDTNDGSSQLGAWAFSGAVKGTNTDADGKVYIDLDGKAAAITEADDGSDQLANWVIAGGVLGTNADTDGKVWVKLEKQAVATITETDSENLFSDWSGITGLVHGVNCSSNGELFVEVTGGPTYVAHFYQNDWGDTKVATATYDATGTATVVEYNSSGLGGTITVDTLALSTATCKVQFPFHRVRIYKESGLTNLVAATGATAQSDWILGDDNGPDSTGAVLTARNTSGLSGSVDIAYTTDDTDISLTLPFTRVSVYSDSARTTLVAQSAWYYGASATALALAAQGGSGLSGTVDVAYTTDDADVYVTLPFIRFEAYSDSARSALVASYGWTYDADAAGTGLTLVEENSSGLSGTLDLDFSTDDSDIEITLPIDFAVGDIFLVSTTCTDDGTFASFWRDYLGANAGRASLPLPADVSGSETIADSLAE